MIDVNCDECGRLFEVSNDDERLITGRLYCEEHSVFRPQYGACPGGGAHQSDRSGCCIKCGR